MILGISKLKNKDGSFQYKIIDGDQNFFNGFYECCMWCVGRKNISISIKYLMIWRL